MIVTTSPNSPADPQECRRLQVTSFVQKPLTIAAFVKATADIFHKPVGVKRTLHGSGR